MRCRQYYTESWYLLELGLAVDSQGSWAINSALTLGESEQVSEFVSDLNSGFFVSFS